MKCSRLLTLVNGLDFSSFCKTMTARYIVIAFTQRGVVTGRGISKECQVLRWKLKTNVMELYFRLKLR